MTSPFTTPLGRIGLLGVLAAAAGLNLLLSVLRITPDWPLTPWEPALLAEGWRWTHGLPVYGGTGGDHATHMYGPLLTVLLGLLQGALGFHYAVVRSVFFLTGATACVWLARLVLPPGRSPAALPLAAVVLLAANLQSGLSFALSWADMPALLCSVAALAALCGGDRTRAPRGIAAALLVVAAVLFKQTAAMTALAFAALWAVSPAWRRRSGGWLLLPAIAVGAVIAGLPAFAPGIWQQMVLVPASISVHPARVPEGLAHVLRGNPLFWLALGLAGASDRKREGTTEIRPWAVAGLLILMASAWTYAKAGGYLNSLLPAALFLSCAAVAMLARFFADEVPGG